MALLLAAVLSSAKRLSGNAARALHSAGDFSRLVVVTGATSGNIRIRTAVT
jgi:hypothetical protein